MSGMKFREANVEVFMGGTFTLPDKPKTVGELKQFLSDCIKELDGWGGNDTPLAEVFFNRDQIDVTLSEGITQET